MAEVSPAATSPTPKKTGAARPSSGSRRAATVAASAASAPSPSSGDAAITTAAVVRPPSATENRVSRRLSRMFSSFRVASGQRSSVALAWRNRL